MKKGYWVVAYRSISDEGALKEYGKLAGVAVNEHGGKALVRVPEPSEAHEGGLNQRTVVIEFENLEAALATYHSENYKKALQALGSAVERDFRIVEGVE
jgi:uncharacterized protein (DUF1330 family)